MIYPDTPVLLNFMLNGISYLFSDFKKLYCILCILNNQKEKRYGYKIQRWKEHLLCDLDGYYNNSDET